MKKNAMLKIAAILMVAVLLTTCAISSTFAKYASNFESIATARVAKWGVKAETEITSLFASEYGDEQNKAPNVKVESGTLGYSGIIAPGTNNHLALNTTLSGKAEVSVTVKYALEITNVNFPDGATDPILWSINGTSWFTADQIDDEVADMTGVTVPAGTDLSTATGLALTIYWKWNFEADDVDDRAAMDANDTEFGKAAEKGESVPSVTVKVTTNIVQSAEAGAPYVAPTTQD